MARRFAASRSRQSVTEEIQRWILWDEDFYSKPDSRARNPACSSEQLGDAVLYRVTRGGYFSHWAIGVSSAKRMGTIPEATDKDIGFRPVFNLP